MPQAVFSRAFEWDDDGPRVAEDAVNAILGTEAREAIQIAELLEVGHARIVTGFSGEGKPAFDTNTRTFKARTIESYPLKNAMSPNYETQGSHSRWEAWGVHAEFRCES